jgi:hypothetical protein
VLNGYLSVLSPKYHNVSEGKMILEIKNNNPESEMII